MLMGRCDLLTYKSEIHFVSIITWTRSVSEEMRRNSAAKR